MYIYIYPRYDSLLPGDCKFLREFCVNVYYKKQASWIDRGWRWKRRGKRRWFRFRFLNQHGKILPVEERWWWLSHQVGGKADPMALAWLCGSQWWKLWRSIFTVSSSSLKRFTVLRIVWPWLKLWFNSIIANTINQSIRTKSKAHIPATNHSAFSSHAHVIKLVNCQS